MNDGRLDFQLAPEYACWTGPFFEFMGHRFPLICPVRGTGTLELSMTLRGLKVVVTGELRGDIDIEAKAGGIYLFGKPIEEYIKIVTLCGYKVVQNYLGEIGQRIDDITQLKDGDLVALIGSEDREKNREFGHGIFVTRVDNPRHIEVGTLEYYSTATFAGKLRRLGSLEPREIKENRGTCLITPHIIMEGRAFIIPYGSDVADLIKMLPCRLREGIEGYLLWDQNVGLVQNAQYTLTNNPFRA